MKTEDLLGRILLPASLFSILLLGVLRWFEWDKKINSAIFGWVALGLLIVLIVFVLLLILRYNSGSFTCSREPIKKFGDKIYGKRENDDEGEFFIFLDKGDQSRLAIEQLLFIDDAVYVPSIRRKIVVIGFPIVKKQEVRKLLENLRYKEVDAAYFTTQFSS